MIKSLFVVDDEFVTRFPSLKAISFTNYLQDYPKLNEPKTRVINLCHIDRHLSQGYYCSLLAEARHHEALPNVKVINALRNQETASIWLGHSPIARSFAAKQRQEEQLVCMGEVADDRFSRIASKVFQQFSAPLLQISVIKEDAGLRVVVRGTALGKLSEDDLAFCLKTLESYQHRTWRKPESEKKFRWDIAMLVNPDEEVPPSNRGAISRFTKAGEKLGIRVRTVTVADLQLLEQFDGLFIRETTAIDHHTYQLAQKAESQGLVVIDDPNSILRCWNKVFLHDAFNYKKIPSLKTQFIMDVKEETLAQLEKSFSYPIVLKMPEGSCSRGVFKVEDRKELQETIQKLLKESALVLAQEYMFTDFDWRIGVLGGRALYACRYYMARNHWQIYNHGTKSDFSGGFDALPTFEVPRLVLDAALKAAAVVGDGLYGIDIKERDGKAFVLEVNDNPSIEHGVEDHYLGEELYMQIMSEFLRRLEARGR
ncbi:RimK family protein [Pseudobacteriovorax antillogorgiicola]|uniref:Glutathione synthase/RimK-type ligase, ATP-grasp superfamily n=1 Tax=Pseudobacteriovorax antillogorgiicola TaxID=1513793 RepID=A0A1Y6BDX4_9BACT|nr:RimK family protein [Pseudobacteriovorax antillogorgiicola]TCS56367.1 glutathione synthase/RimK-type ligase-like ATP-grasp enzyme [Pseudobacteriovorax antillogorgiicola]SMF06636.1 Glutathione synthase/RimK-type ligase, ATP-grasp superfamily [Pseudobacteriovorax antillogorgiicola]